MHKPLIFITGLLLIPFLARSQYRLDIEIIGLRNDKGSIMLQLFNENKEIIKQVKGFIRDKKYTVSIKDLKQGNYAIRFFHDENLSGKLETNLFGKPTEGYGFSNNVTGKFGPPPFEKWLFELRDNKKIILKTIY